MHTHRLIKKRLKYLSIKPRIGKSIRFILHQRLAITKLVIFRLNHPRYFHEISRLDIVVIYYYVRSQICTTLSKDVRLGIFSINRFNRRNK